MGWVGNHLAAVSFHVRDGLGWVGGDTADQVLGDWRYKTGARIGPVSRLAGILVWELRGALGSI